MILTKNIKNLESFKGVKVVLVENLIDS